jgi:hypothetical protein
MASDLKWRTGFGPGLVMVLVGATVAAPLAAGTARWLAIAAAMMTAAYAVYQYRRWNASGWRRVHFRAMLAYNAIAARLRATSGAQGGEPDPRVVCAELGLLLCGEHRKPVVDRMVSDLMRSEGAFLAGLVERHAAEVLPGATFEFRREMAAGLRSIPFGPHLVIASVIENIYGGPEAARYAIAVATGEAP